MTEIVDTRELMKQFGSGWVHQIQLRDTLSEERYFDVCQVLRCEERVVEDDSDPTGEHCQPVHTTHHDAAQACIDAEKVRLEEWRQRAVVWRDRIAQALGWRGVLRVTPLRYRKTFKTQLQDTEDQIARLEASIPTIADRITVHPLPDAVEHYGRLPLGSTVWVLNWDDLKGGIPIFECRVVSERPPFVGGKPLQTDRPSSFEYKVRPLEKQPRDYGDLPLRMGLSGPDMHPRYGLSGFLDFTAALRARDRHEKELKKTFLAVEGRLRGCGDVQQGR